MTEPTLTCQICGRAIKAKNGLIAHHGYQRPGMGWQTASCFGARRRPYEVSCDAIPEAIARTQSWVRTMQAAYHSDQTNPPAEMTVRKKRDAWDKVGVPVQLTRPEGFDPNNNPGSFRLSQQYELHFFQMQRERRRLVAQGDATIAYLQQRLADWRPPSE
jgi:hypothetical protein